MALTNALSIYVTESDKATLRNVYGDIMANLSAKTLAFQLKAKTAILSQKAGSYEFKRFQNADVVDYGTARTAGKGAKQIVPPVVVNVDTAKEIVEEVTAADVEMFGKGFSLGEWANINKNRFFSAFDRYYDRRFFAAAVSGGTALNDHKIDKTKPIRAQLEAIFAMAEKTQNQYVDGIDRELFTLVVDSSLYSLARDQMNDTFNFGGTVQDKAFHGINGVPVVSSTRLPSGTAYVLLTPDSIAQPTFSMLPESDPFTFEKIQLSADYAFGMFMKEGTKVIAPDVVWHGTYTA